MPSRLFERLDDDAALRRAEQLLSALGGIVWEAEPTTGDFVFVSDHAVRILGFPLAEWLRPGFWADALHPEDRETTVAARRAAMRTRQDHELDYRMVDATGAVAWLRDIASITLDAATGEPRLRGLIVDVTAQKRTERALRRTTDELVRAQQLAKIRSFAYDLTSARSVEAAPAASFEHFLRHVHPDDAGPLRAHLDSTFASDASQFCTEFRYLEPGRPLRHVAAVGHVVRDVHGRAMRVFGTTQDVTKQRADEAASREHVRFLESLDEVNRAMHGATRLAQAMGAALEALLPIFDCQRAWIACRPPDGGAPWTLAYQRSDPAFPGAGTDHTRVSLPTDTLDHLAGSEEPLRHDPGDAAFVAFVTTLGVRSQIAMGVTPEGQTPYVLGLHRCRDDRAWTAAELRLFKEIGRRVREVLRTLLAHEALAVSEQRLAEAQRLTQLGYWERDSTRRLVRVSRETAAILGAPTAPSADLASLDDLWHQRIHPDDRAAVLRAQDRAWRGLAPFDVEYRVLIPPAGDVRFVRSTGEVTRDDAGRPVRWFGTLQDITARRRAEHAAAESHAVMRAIVEGTSDAIWVKALDGRYLMVNRAFADQRDATVDDIVGTRDDVDGGQGLTEDEVAVLASGDARTFERHGVVQRARRSFLDVTFPYFDPAGAPVGLIGVSRETTALKHLELELRQAQKMEAIGRLAGGVAHNFNNLLTVILGYAEVLGLGLRADDPNQEQVSEIVKSAERAAAMTRQLLSFSRTQPVAPHVVDVGAALKELQALLRPLIAEDIEMSVHVDDDLGAVVMDGGEFEQALTHLIVNASDAMPRGGRLRTEALNISVGAHDAVPGALLGPGDYVEVRVWDSGCGMDAATRARIFEPFFTTKPAGKGAGLGLSMVYGFVTQLGGYIDVTSTPGAGSLFRLLLPRSANAPPRSERPPAAVSTPRGVETILLVEDEDAVRNVARLVLASRGYRVLDAANGIEALDVARRHSGDIDLLLSDLVMPRMNGQQLAERLALERPAVRVLLMSGYPDRVVPSGAATDPRFEFLSKPFQPSTLARRVRECLDRGRVPARD